MSWEALFIVKWGAELPKNKKRIKVHFTSFILLNPFELEINGYCLYFRERATYYYCQPSCGFFVLFTKPPFPIMAPLSLSLSLSSPLFFNSFFQFYFQLFINYFIATISILSWLTINLVLYCIMHLFKQSWVFCGACSLWLNVATYTRKLMVLFVLKFKWDIHTM